MKKHLFACLLINLILIAIPFHGISAEALSSTSSNPMTINDGKRDYRIWRDPQHMAKIQYRQSSPILHQTKKALSNTTNAINTNQSPLQQIEKLTIVPITSISSTHSTIKSTNDATNTVFAPIYYTKPHQQGEMLIFSGQAIVTPPSDWTIENMNHWAEQQSIQQIKALTFTRKTRYRVTLSPGDAGMQQLLDIAAQGEVNIIPDWRRKKSIR